MKAVCCIIFILLELGGAPIISAEECLEKSDIISEKAGSYGMFSHDSTIWHTKVSCGTFSLLTFFYIVFLLFY